MRDFCSAGKEYVVSLGIKMGLDVSFRKETGISHQTYHPRTAAHVRPYVRTR